MDYRLDLSKMDPHTILFVRQNQNALGFHWDFFINATGLVSKYFTKDPPSAIYFKAGEDFDSWVDYKLAVEDGKWINIANPVEACEDAYRKGNRLVKDMNVNIPNTIYVDAYGYEYHIPLNDGTVPAVYREKITAGNPELSEVGLSQFSVYNTSLPFEERHLMDDLKLDFKEPGKRENNIITYNMLMTPFLFDMADPNVAYIRNALRMSNYQALDSESDEFSLPLSPVIGSSAKYIPHGELDLDKGKFNKFFMSQWGTLYVISSDNKLRQSRDFNTLNWEEITVPPLISASRNPIDSRTDVELEGLFPKQSLIVAPGPAEYMLFAYDAECFKNGAPGFYNQFAVSYDNGAHWTKNFYDDIIGSGPGSLIEPTYTEINDGTGKITIGQEVNYLQIMYIPYPKSPDKLMIAVANDAGWVRCYESSDGVVWNKLPFPDDIPFIITPKDTIAYHTAMFKKNFYSPRLVPDMYIDQNKEIHIKYGTSAWKTVATVDFIEEYILSSFNQRFGITLGDLADEEINIVYRFDTKTQLLQVGYYVFGFGLLPQIGDNEPSYDKRSTIGVYQETGTFYIRPTDGFTATLEQQILPIELPNLLVNSTHTLVGIGDIQIINEQYTHKTIQKVMEETGQVDIDSIHGDYMVAFNPDNVYFLDGKWVIRDTMGAVNAGDPYHTTIGNTDRQGGFMFRVSEDFVHWFPVRGIEGEPLPNNPTVHVYADVTNSKGIVFVVQDNKAFVCAVPRKGIWHYTMRANIHKWENIKLSQQIKANYIVDGTKIHAYDTDDPPVKIGFPFALDPKATILIYNGVPIFDGSAYVNPLNHNEIIISNMVEKYMMQQTILPIQYKKGRRKYAAEDFTVIIASSKDPTKEVHLFISPGKAYSYGKEVFVDFNTNLSGDLILFNGIDHEYEITGKTSIKYTFSRFGIAELIYGTMQYNTSGYTNYLSRGNHVYRIQFLLADKK
jgi:hypothetical protein